jgi:hypothetical protein
MSEVRRQQELPSPGGRDQREGEAFSDIRYLTSGFYVSISVSIREGVKF